MTNLPETKQIFSEFCEWLVNLTKANSEQKTNSAKRFEEYKKYLQNSGFAENEIEARLKIVETILFEIDIERWNRFYLDDSKKGETFPPNRFLREVVEKLPVGKGLDIGIGQGRNSLYLARRGWQMTGLDASKNGIELALRQAGLENLHINVVLTDFEKYDFGIEKWDLILLLYVPVKNIAGKIAPSLKSGGKVIIESYHNDARKSGTFGDKVTFDSNELPEIFKDLTVYDYKELNEFGDFGEGKIPLVRFYGGKPLS